MNMNWVKVVFINLLIFFVLLITAKAIWRSALTVESCFESKCNLNYITKIKIHDDKIGHFRLLFRFDNRLGYVPREGSDFVIDDQDWIPGAKVTISADGYRLNNVDMPLSSSDILAVGDSFTFGTQVSNHQTWPACLERKLKRGIDNYGVAGYGAAQALERALLKIAQKKYSVIIFSILVGDDFNRDRLSYRYGFPKPSLIKENNEIRWSLVSDPNKPGSVFNSSKFSSFLHFFYKRSTAFCYIMNKIAPRFSSSFQLVTETHPYAANIEDIIYWTLKRFSEIKIPSKILLLQYRSNLDDLNMLTEREMILKVAHQFSIEPADTFDCFRGYNPKKIWLNHHTPIGNEIVCNYLFENWFK